MAMDYLANLLKRANWQQVGRFLQDGSELYNPEPGGYAQRLRDGMEKMTAMADAYFPQQREAFLALIRESLAAYQEAYMEMGLQAGFLLAIEQRAACKGVWDDAN